MKPPAVHHEHQLLRFQDCSTDLRVEAATTASASVIPAKAGYTVYVRAITASIFTAGASTLTFRDTAGTPSVLAVLSSESCGVVGQYTVLDAFSKGIGLAEGKGLDLVGDAAAAAGVFYIEAYYFPSSPTPSTL
jgi:hypothetical protein